MYDALNHEKDSVLHLLEAAENKCPVNLTHIFIDSGKAVTLDIIANSLLITWEGYVLKAQLYIHPFVMNYGTCWSTNFLPVHVPGKLKNAFQGFH